MTFREFRKLSILSVSWCWCHGLACAIRFLTKASITRSFQAVATRLWTWVISGMSKPVRVNRKSGFTGFRGETQKLILVEDQTFLSRRVSMFLGVRLWMRKVYGCFPPSEISFIGKTLPCKNHLNLQ